MLEFEEEKVQKIDEAVVEKVVEEIIENVNPLSTSLSELKENIATNEDAVEVKPHEIYNGYHREKTFQIMNKYMNMESADCDLPITEELNCSNAEEENQEERKTNQSEPHSNQS